MTYRSESRGLIYTAPPSEDDGDRTVGQSKDATEAEDGVTDDNQTESVTETPEVESTNATTDANWTGTVPADD